MPYPSIWLFVELPNGTYVVLDVEPREDGKFPVLSESPVFDKSGQCAEIGETQ